MKALETKTKVIFRFRCDRCKSLYEITEEERKEIDWKYGEHKKGGEYTYPHNPINKFYCPTCDTVRYMDDRSIHKYFVMDNGNEVMDY